MYNRRCFKLLLIQLHVFIYLFIQRLEATVVGIWCLKKNEPKWLELHIVYNFSTILYIKKKMGKMTYCSTPKCFFLSGQHLCFVGFIFKYLSVNPVLWIVIVCSSMWHWTCYAKRPGCGILTRNQVMNQYFITTALEGLQHLPLSWTDYGPFL